MIKKFFNFLGLICVILPLLTSCESRKVIVNGLEEREANEILVFLATKNIEATKIKTVEAGGGGRGAILFDISVPSDKATEAMQILSQHGLPRRMGSSLLSIFKESGLVPSELQEKIKYQSGLAEQIASTIRKIDGVLDASVQISFPEEDPLNPGKKKGNITASVYVKHSGVLDDPNSQLITKIKRLVSGSVTGLDIDNVTLISDRARFGESPLGFAASEEDKQYVNIWSLIIAKESVTRFRIIFFSFILALLGFILAFIWLGWKIFPLLKQHGGLSALFNLQPIITEEPNEKIEESTEKEMNEDDEDDDHQSGSKQDIT